MSDPAWWVVLGLERDCTPELITMRSAVLTSALRAYARPDRNDIVLFFTRATLAGLDEKNALPQEAEALWRKLRDTEGAEPG
jgi:hypothetical protein